MLTWDLLREGFRSGSIAALAMIPFGLLFFMLGLRINEYGRGPLETSLRFTLVNAVGLCRA